MLILNLFVRYCPHNNNIQSLCSATSSAISSSTGSSQRQSITKPPEKPSVMVVVRLFRHVFVYSMTFLFYVHVSYLLLFLSIFPSFNFLSSSHGYLWHHLIKWCFEHPSFTSIHLLFLKQTLLWISVATLVILQGILFFSPYLSTLNRYIDSHISMFCGHTLSVTVSSRKLCY